MTTTGALLSRISAGSSPLLVIQVSRSTTATAEMTGRVAQGKTLPSGVIAQVAAKPDGVPLFVEELTKMVLESGLLQEEKDRYELRSPLPPLAIPATLHDSLMARLDRLAAEACFQRRKRPVWISWHLDKTCLKMKGQ